MVWRDEEGGHRKLRSNNHSTSDDGRVVSVEFTNPTAERKAPVVIIGVYGVAGGNRTEEAKHVWKTIGRRIRDYHRYHPDGGVIMTGDFNAHANSQDGPRMNLTVDTEFATMLARSRLMDTAMVTGGADLGPTHRPRNGKTKEGDVAGNRLDRVYVSGVTLMAAVLAAGVGSVPEDKVTETYHGMVWCDIHTGVWESPIIEPILPFKPRVASQGVGEFTHPRSKGVPTRLCNPMGVVATAAETVEWMKAAGYGATDLVE